MIQTIPITKAKDELSRLITNAHKKRDEYTITVGDSSATIISTDELESLRETLEIMSNPELMQDIREAEEEVERGDVVTLEEFEKELSRLTKITSSHPDRSDSGVEGSHTME